MKAVLIGGSLIALLTSCTTRDSGLIVSDAEWAAIREYTEDQARSRCERLQLESAVLRKEAFPFSDEERYLSAAERDRYVMEMVRAQLYASIVQKWRDLLVAERFRACAGSTNSSPGVTLDEVLGELPGIK